MRLIGTFPTENEAYVFYSFLLKEGIQNIYEASPEKNYRVWIYDEDDLDVANEWLKTYHENPADPRFQNLGLPLASPKPAEVAALEEEKFQPIQAVKIKERSFSLILSSMVILLCSFLFFWNNFQEEAIYKKAGPIGVEIGMTPLMKTFFFDEPASYQYIQEAIDTYPLKDYKDLKEIPAGAVALIKKAEETLSWKGILSAASAPMFVKIREGQVWRLFTPCLMHRDFLHILFNMTWAWVLLRQIETRLAKYKICLLVLAIGIVSNIAQYLMSGPYFLGFSGVVVGLAGFIWMRQKKAPWEGYPLKKGMILFMVVFILAMFALELFTLGLKLFSSVEMTPNIANTAHIVGGLTGIFLGRVPFFARRMA